MSTNNKKRSALVEKIINLDKRIVYIFIFLAVTIPFFLKPVVKLNSSPWAKRAYEIVDEAAKVGKPILISFDYDPATIAELQPMAKAILRHAFSKGIKVVAINNIPNGTSLGAVTMDSVAKEFNKEYGKDYVYLGYVPQTMLVMLNFGEDFRKSYVKDFRGLLIKDIPILNNIQNYADFHVVIDLSGTAMPKSFIVFGVEKYNFNFITGATAVSGTEYFTYLQSGQMDGLLIGMKGAAEYEGLSGFIGDAMSGMASQSWGHIVILLFIIIGNVLYYVKKRMDKQNA